MAKLRIEFTGLDYQGVPGWDTEPTRNQIMQQLRNLPALYPNTPDLEDHVSKVVAGLASHGMAAIELIREEDHLEVTCKLLWYAIWGNNGGDPRLQERAGIDDMLVRFEQTAKNDDGTTTIVQHVGTGALPTSKLLPSGVVVDGRRLHFMAYATSIGGKTIFTGAGIGRRVKTDDPGIDTSLTETGQQVYRILEDHCKGEIKTVEINGGEGSGVSQPQVRNAIRQIAMEHLRNAEDGDGLFFLCANDKIIDALNLVKLFGLQDMTSRYQPDKPPQVQCQRCGKINEALPGLIHNMCVECGHCIIHNTDHLGDADADGNPTTQIPNGQPLPQKPFAPLANAALRTLASPGYGGGLSAEAGDMFVALRLVQQWNKKNRERLFGGSFARNHTLLRQAHKFVFDQEFSRLVMEASEQDPLYLHQLLQTARPPFETCWIEWDRQSQPDREDSHLTSLGVLLNRRNDIPDDDQYEVTVMVPPKPPAPQLAGIWPTSMLLSFRGEAQGEDEMPPHVDALPMFALTKAYCQRWNILGPPANWPAKYRQAVEDLVKHCRLGVGFGPYGRPFAQLIERAHTAQKTQYEEYIDSLAGITLLPFREIIAGLALVATHIGGNPLVTSKTATTPRTFYRGQFHRSFEYRVLTLARPMTAPQLFRRPATRRPGPLPEHGVLGHWKHRSEPNEHCRHHPLSCPIVAWQPLDDVAEDREPEAGDRQACIRCQRKRWWMKDHRRGDRSVGIIEKDYNITAPRRPHRPSPPT